MLDRLIDEAKHYTVSKGWPFMWVQHGMVHRVSALEVLALEAEEVNNGEEA